jgi:hypothetical protein
VETEAEVNSTNFNSSEFIKEKFVDFSDCNLKNNVFKTNEFNFITKHMKACVLLI